MWIAMVIIISYHIQARRQTTFHRHHHHHHHHHPGTPVHQLRSGMGLPTQVLRVPKISEGRDVQCRRVQGHQQR